MKEECLLVRRPARAAVQALPQRLNLDQGSGKLARKGEKKAGKRRPSVLGADN
jgi:hypothetical protein